MKIVKKQISELEQAEYNPRYISKEDFEQLKISLTKYKCVEPAVINVQPGRHNVIIGGHQRIKAASSLGWKEFPCVEVKLDEKEERELNIRLNKNTGDFDFDILANEFEIDDLIEWGFDGDEFDIGLEFEEEEEKQESQKVNEDMIMCPKCGERFKK